MQEMKNTKERRTAYSAPTTEELNVTSEVKLAKLLKHAKSDAVRRLINGILTKHFLFSQMSERSMMELVDYMFHLRVPKGQPVVKQVRQLALV